MAIYYLDYEGGNNANAGTSFATRWKTLVGGAAGLVAGDTVRVMGSPDPVSLGTNVTFTFQSGTATLAAAKTTHICDCDNTWTGTTYVTTASSSDAKQGSYSASLAVSSSHSGGKVAYYTLPSTLDLSAYTKVSFWFKVNNAVLGSKIILKLCSDTTGDTALHTFTITADRSFPNGWMPFTFLSSATPEGMEYLSDAVNSVAVYTDGGIGDVQINFDNILACNDLTLTCVIGQESSATSFIWYPIRYIDGTNLKFEWDRTAYVSSSPPTWHAATKTSTCYVRETIRLEFTESTSSFPGSADSLITFSCGWNRTDMSTQTGLTFVMPDNGNSYKHELQAKHWQVSRLGTVYNDYAARYGQKGKILSCGFYGSLYSTTESYAAYSTCYFIANQIYGLYNPQNSVSITDCKFYSNQYAIFAQGDTDLGYLGAWQNIVVKNCDYGVYTQRRLRLDNIDVSYGYVGIYSFVFGETEIGTAKIDNCTYGLYVVRGVIKSHNTTITNVLSGGAAVYGNVQITDLNGGGMVQYANSSSSHIWIEKVASPVHGTSTISIKHTPKLDQNFEWMPLSQLSQPFAVKASAQVTCKVWARRTNTTVQGLIRIPAAYTKGLVADVTAALTAAADTWQELTVTFTPTANTVGILIFESYNNSASTSGSVYFGDVTVTQA